MSEAPMASGRLQIIPRGDEVDVQYAGKTAGVITFRDLGDGVVQLGWSQAGIGVELGHAVAAALLLVEHCFQDLGAERVQVVVAEEDAFALRVARRAGFRREGLLRGGGGLGAPGGRRTDLVLLARLVTDPPLGSPSLGWAIADANLPKTRVIAQGLAVHEGRVLLCELSYKSDWDLPGGIAEPDEPPAVTLARELQEELGVAVRPGPLVAVDWLPPYQGWSDAVLLVFRLDLTPEDLRDTRLNHEVEAVHWCPREELGERVAAYVRRMLSSVLDAPDGGSTCYLEDGIPPSAARC